MSGLETIDKRVKSSHSSLSAGLEGIRKTLGQPRREIGARMGLSESGLANLEGKRRGLKPATLLHWCRALGLPGYMDDVVAALFLPGLIRLRNGTWPPQMSSGLIRLLDTIPYPVTILRVPEQDILHQNPEARRMTPWLNPAPLTSPEPTNLAVEAMTNPEAKKSWVNWTENAHKSVFLLRVRGEGTVDPQRMEELRTRCETNPSFNTFWNTFLTEEDMAHNVSVLRDPDTDEAVEYETYTMKCIYPDRDTGEIVFSVPREPRGAAAEKSGDSRKEH